MQGQNLRGRECGKGIFQRKDGKYSARYIAGDGSRLLGHASTKTIMDRYVHVTEDSLTQAVRQFESRQAV